MTAHPKAASDAPPRLAIVLSHPTQYYSPWFRWLTRNTVCTLRVFYLWDSGVTAKRDPQFNRTFAWDVDLLSGYEHEFVPNLSRHPGTEGFNGLRNPSLTRRLDRWKPEVILLFGYAYRSHIRVILWAWRTGIPLLFRGDSHFLGRSAPAGLRGMIMRSLFRRFAAVTYVGQANRDYFRALGVPESRLFFAPHAVDNDLFNPANSQHQHRAAAMRSELGIPSGTVVVMFAGKLIPSKQPRLLLDAFLELGPKNTALVFVGEGAEKSALLAQSNAFGATGASVHFVPFTNQSDMPSRYLAASLFVLPSRGYHETWGLAVNEAMQMGVPCLVSDRVGCQRDLVTDGETGWVFSSEQPGALRANLARALNDLATRRKEIREAVRARIAGYSYSHAAAGLNLALKAALSA